MKNVKRFSGLLTLMLFSQVVWSFSLGFESSNPDLISNFIQHNNAFVYLAAFFGVGVLLAFTPCVLPMVPILSGIIIGQESLSTRKALKLSLGYVAGMAITYAAVGVLAGFMGSTIQTQMQRPGVIVGFSSLFVLMALSMFGFFELSLPAKMSAGLNFFRPKNTKHNVISAGLMGMLSTLVVSPCVTAPLIGVLTYIGQNGDALTGGLILFIMAIGMGLPLILVGAGYGSVLPKTGSWMLKIKQLFGFMMLAIAIWMLGRILPTIATNLLWAALLIIVGFVLGVLKSPSNRSGRLFQLIGLAALIAGSVLLYNSVSTLRQSQPMNLTVGKAPFIEANSLQAIQQELAKAKKENKPAFLEFSASWCSDCQEMDAKVFSQSDVAKAMAGLVSLRIEISEKTQEVADIKKYFAIYGTPSMLFFNSKGEQLKQLTAVGVIDKTALIKLLNSSKTLN
ncbi:MAG: protein-disulfide reductase DsbD [Tatlockia sp.]|nr:protein-disulfide reductase DsbD [Tatlockia sp.]